MDRSLRQGVRVNILRIFPEGGIHEISVLVAVGRDALFWSMALPSIIAARPREIVIATGDGLASAKWNACAAVAKCDICFVCADDFYINPMAFDWMCGALVQSPNASIAYGDHAEVGAPMRASFHHVHECGAWGTTDLANTNHIGVYAFRKSHIGIPFDESLARYEDWDLMIRLQRAGQFGIYIPRILVVALFVGNCISKPEGDQDARFIILSKYAGSHEVLI